MNNQANMQPNADSRMKVRLSLKGMLPEDCLNMERSKDDYFEEKKSHDDCGYRYHHHFMERWLFILHK